MEISKVCVYCSSSRQADAVYLDAAGELGRLLAEAGVTTVYGGGAVGSMGRLADEAIAAGGRVVGVLPRFMDELEWGHGRLTDLVLVENMHVRKQTMATDVDGIVALPGGSGTLEELLEAITWKRLGLLTVPIVIVNVRGYFDPLVTMLERAVTERLMDGRHREMWSVVDGPKDVLTAIRGAPEWTEAARNFAVP